MARKLTYRLELLFYLLVTAIPSGCIGEQNEFGEGNAQISTLHVPMSTILPDHSFPQKANATAPSKNKNDTAWFHLMLSPRYDHANTTKTQSVITSWITFN